MGMRPNTEIPGKRCSNAFLAPDPVVKIVTEKGEPQA
jgi:hypothetical protein